MDGAFNRILVVLGTGSRNKIWYLQVAQHDQKASSCESTEHQNHDLSTMVPLSIRNARSQDYAARATAKELHSFHRNHVCAKPLPQGSACTDPS